MALDANDERLTAFVLDELDDVEQGEIAAALGRSLELRTIVSELRETADKLREALAGEDRLIAAKPIATNNGRLHETVLQAVRQAAASEKEIASAGEQRAIPSEIESLSSDGKVGIEGLTASSQTQVALALPPRREPPRRRLTVVAIAASIAALVGVLTFALARFQSPRRLNQQLAWHQERDSGSSVAGSEKPGQTVEFGDSNPQSTVSSPTGPAQASASGRREIDEIKLNVRGRLQGRLTQEKAKESVGIIHEHLKDAVPATEGRTSMPRYIANGSSPQNSSVMSWYKLSKSDRSSIERDQIEALPQSRQYHALSRRQLNSDPDIALAESRSPALLVSGNGGQKGGIEDARDERLDELRRLAANRPVAGENPQAVDAPHNTESYARIYDNPFRAAADQPLSTFSIDVDTASYANVRRFLTQGQLPPADAVRIEELVNYFSYHYEPPVGDAPLAVRTEVTACPWNPRHRLLRIALKAREIAAENRPASNLVFLLDVSGSMDEPNKLPLVKEAMRLLTDKLTENDRVAIVVYAGASGVVLESTHGDNKETIRAAIDNLRAGGSTNGASGIQLAYDLATANLIEGGANRVILCTDGDFNVGITNEGDLTRLIEEKTRSGVFLSVLGFGMGNYKDATLEMLADKGNGNYGYIDTTSEARKLFDEQLSGTLMTVAKDVKLQIEFNPARVASYRLLGYENRVLAAEDFNDDQKDAGEIGAGHTVTALYEIVPVNQPAVGGAVEPLKYQQTTTTAAATSDELLTLKLRYKHPEATESKLIAHIVRDAGRSFAEATKDTQFAASVALFGMLLRHSDHAGSGTLDAVLEIATSSRQDDPHGYRRQFIDLVRKAKELNEAKSGIQR